MRGDVDWDGAIPPGQITEEKGNACHSRATPIRWIRPLGSESIDTEMKT